MIHLDTSFLIRALVAGTEEDARLRSWIGEGRTVHVSAVCWAEFLCGPVSSDAIELAAELLGEPVPFGHVEGATAARLFNDSGRRRGSFVDCMVAATAVAATALLATGNREDLEHFVPLGLQLLGSSL